MPLAPRKLRVPLGVQVGAVAALFVAALVALWAAAASVVAREQRRSEAKNLLNLAGTNLADRGIQIIARGGEFPDFPEEASRSRLDRELSTQAVAALADHEGIEGGYFVQRFKTFLGTAALTG
ncbi:MAG: two-component system sensor histidine kinase NtrB, partial [Isosphaeraceae bacterium]